MRVNIEYLIHYTRKFYQIVLPCFLRGFLFLSESHLGYDFVNEVHPMDVVKVWLLDNIKVSIINFNLYTVVYTLHLIGLDYISLFIYRRIAGPDSVRSVGAKRG